MARRECQLVGLFLAVLTFGPVSCCPDLVYESLIPAPMARLPADESPHCSGGEWWYYTGHVTTADDRLFGIEAVIFHLPARMLRLPAEGFAAHFAVIEENTGVFVYRQARAFDSLLLSCVPQVGFDLHTPLVQMTGQAGVDHVRASTSNVYWEGLCRVSGTQVGEPVTGTAFVELTNYLP